MFGARPSVRWELGDACGVCWPVGQTWLQPKVTKVIKVRSLACTPWHSAEQFSAWFLLPTQACEVSVMTARSPCEEAERGDSSMGSGGPGVKLSVSGSLTHPPSMWRGCSRMFQMAGQVCIHLGWSLACRHPPRHPSAPMQSVGVPTQALPGLGRGDLGTGVFLLWVWYPLGLPGHLCPLGSGSAWAGVLRL